MVTQLLRLSLDKLFFGPRVPNTDAHDACAQWLSDELERHGAQVTIQQSQYELLTAQS